MRSVRDFVLTDDYAHFATRPLPYPAADWLAAALRHPTVRQILPASVRAPLALPGFGNAPPAPPVGTLLHRKTHTLATPGEWRSARLPANSGWWKFETAGDTGQPGVSLALVSAQDGRIQNAPAPGG